MPSITVQPKFEEPVKHGRKRQEIVAYRQDGHDPKPGGRIWLYAGREPIWCRKLGEAQCLNTAHVMIGGGSYREEIALNGRLLADPGQDRLARDTGFACVTDLLHWVERTHGFPFFGLVIYWGDLQ
jgi:hypothetical protein